MCWEHTYEHVDTTPFSWFNFVRVSSNVKQFKEASAKAAVGYVDEFKGRLAVVTNGGGSKEACQMLAP